MLTLSSEHLLLIACPYQVARAMVGSRRQAETLVGYRIHEEWPGADIRAYLPLYAQQIESDPTRLGWGLWLMIHRADHIVIGDAGFKGKPDASGTVDIGYGLVATYRQQGLGFEAARTLCAWAFQQPGVRRITADCLPENVGSARILEKLGMQRIGTSTSGLLLWELLPTVGTKR